MPTWTAIENGIGPDDFTIDPETGAVSNGPDGIPEFTPYPEGTDELPPGNRVNAARMNGHASELETLILSAESAA